MTASPRCCVCVCVCVFVRARAYTQSNFCFSQTQPQKAFRIEKLQFSSAGPAAHKSSSENVSLLGLEGMATPLQCSCLENPMDRGAWWAAVHGVTKSQT